MYGIKPVLSFVYNSKIDLTVHILAPFLLLHSQQSPHAATKTRTFELNLAPEVPAPPLVFERKRARPPSTMDEKITSFQTAHPDITVLTSSSPDYAARRKRHDLLNPANDDVTPPGIVIPKDAAEVAAFVGWAAASTPPVKFTLRSGGANFWGHNFAADALVLDLRELAAVRVAPDRKTATVGGGIITEALMRALAAEGLLTPTGNWWHVGYAGWATLGGYGPLQGAYGMGFEQIVGAQVVDAGGRLAAASDEVLEGVRGMGGNLGVVTELTIKVYPAHDLLSGMIIYNSGADGLGPTLRRVQTGLASLAHPRAATTHTFVQYLPPLGARVIAVLLTWGSADHAAGRAFVQAVVEATGGDVATTTVAAVSPVAQQEAMPHVKVPAGGQRSAYVHRATAAVVAVAAAGAASIPDEPSPNLSMSGLVALDPAPAPANTFAPAGPHVLVTFSDFCGDAARRDEVKAWTDGVEAQIRACPDVLPGSYPGLTAPGARSGPDLFGLKWARVKELKKKYDPRGVFDLAVPRVDL